MPVADETEKIQVYASRQQRELIEKAAEQEHRSMSSFMLLAALAVAESKVREQDGKRKSRPS